jgi:hypothetical protein
LAIAEQRRQFDESKELLLPYVEAGEAGLSGLFDFMGLNGEEAYQAQIDSVENSPEFQSMIESGEEGILANASATGGLRGGNTQKALAEFRPQVLSNLIDKRYNRFAGIAQMGQASATGQASAGIQTGNNISNLFQQNGAAIAGAQLARGQNNANMIGDLASIFAGGIRGAF